MISRVADHAFWFGRYVERTEATARLLAATRNLALDAELEPAQCWRPVIVVSGEEEDFRAGHDAAADDAPAWGDGDRVETFMTWDEDNPASLLCSVGACRWNARSIREVLSAEVWEYVNELHLWMAGDAAQAEWQAHRYDFYRRVKSHTQLVLGLLRSTMLHDEPLDFIWLGVLLERVSQTARILDVHHHAFTRLQKRHVVVETAAWLSLLRALGGMEPFMKRHQGRVAPEVVARFLIGEDRFPRSIAYCVHSAHERLQAIRPPSASELPGGRTLERLRVLDEWVVENRTVSFAGDGLHDALTHVVDECHAICTGLGQELFGHGS
ncbi:MAG TPA: alpha-E domain-containing protein [Kofleriaceae bacterium]|jgi:uncharacterized alpha-E superfamily protein|nr:alpha-E domain-containing protein [Kofleriaceae bacterium]